MRKRIILVAANGLLLLALLAGFSGRARADFTPRDGHWGPPLPISTSSHWEEARYFVSWCFNFDNPLGRATDDIYVWGYDYLYPDGYYDYALNGQGLAVPIDQKGRYENLSCDAGA